MKQQLLIIPLLLTIISCGKKQKEITPQYKQMTSAVYASGSLVPEREYKVVSGVDGYLEHAYVKEGDTVSDGEILFSLSSEVRNAQESGARAILQKTLPVTAANAPAIKELQGRIDVARIRLQQDSLQYARYSRLYKADAISQSNYEKYYLQYQSSLKDYQSLKQQLQQQQLNSDIQQQQAENQLLVNKAQISSGVLKSFVNGIVYDIYKKQGDLVTPNQPVALIGSGRMIAKLLVDEDDLDQVYEGQKVLITMDAFSDKVFKAYIHKIYPLLNKVEQSFRVDAVLDDIVPVEMYGLNLEANIVTAENKRVLVIPKSALMKGDSVLVKQDGKQKKVKIRKGIEDNEWVEVLGGIDEHTTLITEK